MSPTALLIYRFVVILIGLALTPILFHNFYRLPKSKKTYGSYPTLSVIIPARNEQKNLPLLLQDLQRQSVMPYEIICVDDDSTDATAEVAKKHGAEVVFLKDKPVGWMGKTWACQNGANTATGELLLFLDADVRLGKDALQRLLEQHANCGCTVSVQLYHKTEKAYEQFSLLFNLVQVAANGATLAAPLNVGLYGPVILISRADYELIGGHESVKNQLVEDMALARRLKKAGLTYRLFMGDQELSYRMYSGGFRDLFQGWIKNTAAGAAQTSAKVFWMVFFWIGSLTSVPIQIIRYAGEKNIPWVLVFSLLYFVWVYLLRLLSKKIGHFSFWAILFYPILIFVFLLIFLISLLKKVLGLKVIWKGRSIAANK